LPGGLRAPRRSPGQRGGTGRGHEGLRAVALLILEPSKRAVKGRAKIRASGEGKVGDAWTAGGETQRRKLNHREHDGGPEYYLPGGLGWGRLAEKRANREKRGGNSSFVSTVFLFTSVKARKTGRSTTFKSRVAEVRPREQRCTLFAASMEYVSLPRCCRGTLNGTLFTA